MQEKSLKELSEESKTKETVTYPLGKLVVKVAKVGHTAKFTGSNGVPGSMLNFSIADSTDAMLATLSDETQFNKIKEGRTLQLRNFLVKGKRVVLSGHSKVMSASALELPDGQIQKATLLIMPPSPSKTLREAMDSPLRDIVTIQGQIIRDEAVKFVQVGQKETKIRTITLEEHGNTMEVTLWRDLAESQLKVQDFVEICHCVVSEWQKKKSLNTTRNSLIKTVAPREVDVTGQVEALAILEQDVEMCIRDETKGLKNVKFDLALLKLELSLREDEGSMETDADLEEFLITKLPFKVQVKLSGSNVNSFDILEM
ncbi:uncharacterized protein LOC133202166 [Saccostrea echinata]|uniref:uncharacterized protein LOC133202166 n=1 Tax=Saccostrea echinata TaxID=191078 RepID=UPI002A83E5BA|nr:uncharacterized protein LOC133202166 [Saccostrea echinata]